jgi:hypothetical protein
MRRITRQGELTLMTGSIISALGIGLEALAGRPGTIMCLPTSKTADLDSVRAGERSGYADDRVATGAPQQRPWFMR